MSCMAQSSLRRGAGLRSEFSCNALILGGNCDPLVWRRLLRSVENPKRMRSKVQNPVLRANAIGVPAALISLLCLLSSCAIRRYHDATLLPVIEQGGRMVFVEYAAVSKRSLAHHQRGSGRPNAACSSIKFIGIYSDFEVQSLEGKGPGGRPIHFERIYQTSEPMPPTHTQYTDIWTPSTSIDGDKVAELPHGDYELTLTYRMNDVTFTRVLTFNYDMDYEIRRFRFPRINNGAGH
jgi:hypothetical protein